MGGEFALKPLNLMRPLAPRLPFLFNLILKLLGKSKLGARMRANRPNTSLRWRPARKLF